MATECLLRVEGADLEGEARTDGHAGAIDVLAWSWGLSQSGTLHQPAGRGAGKASVQDLRVTKYVDAATPALVLSCLSGTQFRSATLTCLRVAGDGSRIPYLVIVMQKVIITTVEDTGASGEQPLTESLSLNFAELIVRYTTQKDDGSAGEESAIGWSIRENRRITP